MSKRYAIALGILFVLILIPLTYAQTTTQAEAIQSIQQAEQDMYDLAGSGFSIQSVNDSLAEAKQALERADFAALIKENVSGILAQKARTMLEGQDYEGFTYNDVLIHTQKIGARKQQAYELFDSLQVVEIKIKDYSDGGVNTIEADKILQNARIAFEKERYTETESVLSDLEADLEEKKAEITTLHVVVESSKSYVEKSWPQLLVVISIMILIGFFSWKKIKIKILSNRLEHLKTEKHTLLDLMKKAQRERFQTHKISALVYNIRMEKYRKRINKVKANIPVLQAQLRKSKKNKHKSLNRRETI